MMDALRRSLNQSLEEHLLPRYQQLDSREQKMLLVAALLLPLVIMIFGIMLPLQDQQLSLQKELEIAQSKANKADSLATYLSEHANKIKQNDINESLLSAVERLARQTSVRSFITRIKPQSSPGGGQHQLMLIIKDVPYDSILRFVHAMAQRNMGFQKMKLHASTKAGYITVHAIITSAGVAPNS